MADSNLILFLLVFFSILVTACIKKSEGPAVPRPHFASEGLSADLPRGSHAVLAPLGFDPGLRLRRIASTQSGSPLFFQSCPDLPSGRCLNNLLAGHGFYSLGGNETDAGTPVVPEACRLNSGDLFNHGLNNPEVPCPYSFGWLGEEGTPVANLVVDTLAHRSQSTPPSYLGLETRVFGDGEYVGLDQRLAGHVFPIQALEFVHVTMKAEVCWGPHVRDTERFGRFFYGLKFHSRATGETSRILINLMTYSDVREGEFKERVPFPGYLATEAQLIAAPLRVDTLHLDGKAWGFVPPESSPAFDTSPGCTGASVSPRWHTFKIPVRKILSELLRRGKLRPAAVADGLYAGGILGGSEHHGRVRALLQVKEHSLFARGEGTVTDLPRNGILAAGAFRLARESGDDIYSASGIGSHCKYDDWQHAGVSVPEEMARIHEAVPKESRFTGRCVGGTFEGRGLASRGRYPAGNFRLREDGQIHVYYSNGTGAYCAYNSLDHAGIRPDLVTRVYDRAPQAMTGHGGCPGWGKFELKVPQGKFRLSSGKFDHIYYSSGNEAYCRYATLAQAGVSSPQEVATEYSTLPEGMRYWLCH